jgi:hypothetical protein
MHDVGHDVGESGPAPWLRAFVDAGLVALERRLAAESGWTSSTSRLGPRMRTSDRPELYRRECVPSAG